MQIAKANGLNPEATLKNIKVAENLPFNPLKLRNVIKIKKKIDWSNFKIEPNILYSSPSQKAIDLFILEENTLILTQITTQQNVNCKKVKTFIEEVERIKLLKSMEKVNVKSFFISLFDFQGEKQEKQELYQQNDLILLIADDLRKIFGQELYIHLVKVKKIL